MKKLFATLLLTALATGSVFAADMTWDDLAAAMKQKDQAKMEQFVKEFKPNAIKETNNSKKFRYLSAVIHVDKGSANRTITADNFDTKIPELMTELKFTEHINNNKLNAMAIVYWLHPHNTGDRAKILNKVISFIESNYNELKENHNTGVMYREGKNFQKAFEVFKNSNSKNNGPYALFHLINKTNLTDSQIKEAIDCLIKNQQVINTPQRLDTITSIIEKKLINPKYDTDVKRLLLVLNRSHYSKISVSESWKASIVKLQLLMKSYNL
jgi:hypothetical protein